MTTERKDGGPAYPVIRVCDKSGVGTSAGTPGMTLRDYFAGQALAGLLTHGTREQNGERLLANTARAAYAFADAMIAERKK